MACRCILTVLSALLIASQLVITCYLATNTPLPSECIVPYHMHSFDIKADLRYLLTWFNILLLSAGILLMWTSCANAGEESMLLCCARAVFLFCIFIMLMETTFSSLHVLDNNAGCWRTPYGAFTVQCVATIFASMLLAFMIMCFVAISFPPPHDLEDPNP